MAHGLENLIVKLNGPGDEQSGVGCLGRHGGLLVVLGGWGGGKVSCGRVGQVVCGAGQSLGGEGSIQGELRSVVEMSRDETETVLGRQLE